MLVDVFYETLEMHMQGTLHMHKLNLHVAPTKSLRTKDGNRALISRKEFSY